LLIVKIMEIFPPSIRPPADVCFHLSRAVEH